MNVLDARPACRRVLALAEVLRDWLDHRARCCCARTEYPPGRDRPAAGSARRLSDRLSEPRRGDPASSAPRTSRSRR
ncbi:MAG: hypothetical protein MZV49_02640 [Rhodopseudomonas palustris]|nr:hypothetical protein [Rhodopseudomonas palustris]